MMFRPVAPRATGWAWALFCMAVAGALLPLAVVGWNAWGLWTLRYEVTPSELVIRFGGEQVRLPRVSITWVEVLTPTGGRRHRGTAMPGLYTGRWSFAETGPIQLYSTSLRPLTVVGTGHGKWGISPADPEGFRAALLTGQAGVWEPSRTGSPLAAMAGFMLIFGVGAPAGAVGILWYVVRLGRNLSYHLTDTAVEVRGGWSPVRIPYEKITGVALAEPAGRPWKVFGIGVPGWLYWGDYVWRQAGPRLRLYATRYRPLVVISAGRGTYGLTPVDPERFSAELQARIPSAVADG